MEPTTSASAAEANTTSSASVTNDNRGSRGSNPEGRCENPNCNFGKLLSMVPRSKCTQFVTEPKVVQKPLLVNGFTTVFQLDGQSAKLCDVKDPDTGNTESRTIFRIVPNTHAHIVNYVVVDEEDSVRKIHENDPATMQKLLQSQRVSAAQMLKKLMGTGLPTTMATAPAASVSSVANKNAANTANRTPVPGTAATNAPPSTIQAATVNTHPNLMITSVQGGDDMAAATAPAAPVLPLITPVPLANLQNSPLPAASPAPVQPIVPVAAAAPPDMEKMRSEIEELRRTVAQLAQMKHLN